MASLSSKQLWSAVVLEPEPLNARPNPKICGMPDQRGVCVALAQVCRQALAAGRLTQDQDGFF